MFLGTAVVNNYLTVGRKTRKIKKGLSETTDIRTILVRWSVCTFYMDGEFGYLHVKPKPVRDRIMQWVMENGSCVAALRRPATSSSTSWSIGLAGHVTRQRKGRSEAMVH